MKRHLISYCSYCVVLTLTVFIASPSYSAVVPDYSAYTAVPPFISSAVPPMVLMIMGRDHKLYKPAYNDASDIDDDGKIESTYKHSIDYYGYFDPYKCYDYGSIGGGAASGFFPVSKTADKYCDGTKWSGNFLDWLGTSRIDALRRVLYGGYRSVDNTSLTVLAAEHINEDAHSWGKEYNGGDLGKLTPFFTATGGTLLDCFSDWTTTQVPVVLPATANIPTAPGCVSDGTSYYEVPQKILEVTYDDSKTGVYGNNNADMLNSFSLCDYKSASYIDDFNNSDLVKTGSSCVAKTLGGTAYTLSCPVTQDHLDSMNRILVTEFEVTSANAGNWDFAIDGDDGVEVELGQYDHATDSWTSLGVVAAYYGNHGAQWSASPYGPNVTSSNSVNGTCDGVLSGTPPNCASQIHTNFPLIVGWYRMIVRLRENTGSDGVKVFYRNPETRLAGNNGNNWIVFGAASDINGFNMASTTVTSGGQITVNFYALSDTIVRSSGSFLVDGFLPGDKIDITGYRSSYTYDGTSFIISNISADGTTITTTTAISKDDNKSHKYSFSATRTSFTPASLNYRAPNVPTGESIRFKDQAFIVNGEPSWKNNPSPASTKDLSGNIPACSPRVLFCVTSPTAEDATHPAIPIIRALTTSTHRVWEWASTERAVCSGPETPAGYQHLIANSGGSTSIGAPAGAAAGDYMAYNDQVEVCDPTVGLESWCKLYPGGGGTYKPAGLFQKYGESQNTVCSKSFLACTTDADCTAPQTCIQQGQMLFGLMTGSYTKNMSGGVIRSNISSMSNQVDNKNVGQLKSPGGAAGSDGFPITNLDKLRMTGFNYGSYSYNCGWIENRLMKEGECTMWGNPIAEMMYEGLRYFAGKGAPTAEYASGTGAAGTDDATLGLTNQSDPTNKWIKPYDKFPLCSKPFMIVLSDVNPSYDSDQLPGVDSNFLSSGPCSVSSDCSAGYTCSGSVCTRPAFTGDLTGLTSVKDLADTIGKTEGINGSDVFIGQSGALNDMLCTSKPAGILGNSTTGLGSIRGQCAEEPTKQGSYYSASVAYYGKTAFGQNNTDSSGDNLPNVTTYSVALQSPVPEIKIKAGSNTIKIIPVGKSVSGCLGVDAACMANCSFAYNIAGDASSGLKINNCSSTAFCPTNQIVGFYIDGDLNDTYGKFRVSFEDSEQGADHEMDAIVEYSYQVDSVTGQVTINLNSSYAAGCIDQVMGFVISGTTEDGTYLAVRDLDDASVSSYVKGLPTSWSKTFSPSVTGSTTQFLHNPLWYAAKWGGFDDTENDKIPYTDATCGTATPNAKCQEWDKDGNGVPDTYFLISNPLKMEQQLTQVFEDILKKSASGTSVSILATSAEGEGSLYQAYFYPEKPNPVDNSRKFWLGYVRGLFLDTYGNLREDSNNDAKLIFNDDKVIQMTLDPTTNQVSANRYLATSETGSIGALVDTVPIDDISSLWEAGAMLGKKDKSTRNLYVWVDKNNDGVVNNGDFSSLSGEALDLSAANDLVLRPYLNTSSTATADNIISFIRGNEVAGLRDRCLPVSGSTAVETGCNTASAGDRVWALGDIIYSTPTTVSSPKEQYDQIYGDTSYIAFRQMYANRRNVVYVGGNDGMLHAFNSGVYHAGDDPHTGAIEHGWFDANPSSGNGWLSPLPALGDELWSFIPYDDLPHLQWLTDPAYNHVYYVDLRPKVTDVRMFNDAGTGFSGGIDGQSNVLHPNGWGTIVIVGLRFGGGAIDVTQDFGSGVATTRTFRSAYYVLDITNPEYPPKLLWRFTDSTLGFSTTYPAIAHIKSGSTEKWFMVVGSGPDNNVPGGTRGYDGSSTQTGKVFIVNLMDGTLARTFSTDANSFMGDPTVMDGDLDYSSDVIYIGNAISTTLGKVYRINTNSDLNPANWQLSTLINQGRPVLVGPSVASDALNNRWVIFGTGRFWSLTDKSNADQQTLYGIKDACWKSNTTVLPCTTTYTLTDLKNTSTMAVCSSNAGANAGEIFTGGSGTCGSGTVAYTSYGGLLNDMRLNYKGWYLNLKATAGNPSERALSKSVVIGGLALMTAFTPNSDPCAVQGNSELYALYYETGTAYNQPAVGTTGSGTSETVNRTADLGKGLPTTVGMAIGKSSKGYIQTSTGAIVVVDTQPALTVRSGSESWKEIGGSQPGIEEIYRHIVK